MAMLFPFRLGSSASLFHYTSHINRSRSQIKASWRALASEYHSYAEWSGSPSLYGQENPI